jgi:alpha-L-rhamnosidase
MKSSESPNPTPALLATRLRCGHSPEPSGLDTPKPRLCWNLQSPRRNVRQAAWHVLVATSAELLARDCGDAWDSGRRESEESLFVGYSGEPLRSAQRYFWKVRVWDLEGNVSPWSEPASWQMELLEDADWDAGWIGAAAEPTPCMDRHKREETKGDSSADPLPTPEELDQQDRDPGFAAVLLRKEIRTSAPVRRVTAFVCGLGAYALEINGCRVGGLLEPAHTHYNHRVQYRTIDVTEHWREGGNAVAVTLGNGWWHLAVEDLFGNATAPWRGTPRLRLRIEIELADASTQTLVSDKSWKWRTGPVTFNCIRGGEDYDARRERPGWSLPDYDDAGWKPVLVLPPPKGKLVAGLLHPVRVTETVQPVSITSEKPGEWTFDFGVQLAGWVRLRVRGAAGQTVEMNFPGAPSHTHGRYQVGRYTLKGEGEEVYEPAFTHHGFRKVIVRGLPGEPTNETLTACNVHSVLPSVGEFSCSNEKINTLQSIVRRTAQNYILHHPADPTREKMGWSQDVQNMFPTQCYNFESAPVYLKWLDDMFDAQDARGFVPPIMPTPGWTYEGDWNGPWWAGMIVFLPWNLYQFHGDRRPLEEGYAAMKAFVDWMRSIEGKTTVWCSPALGDEASRDWPIERKPDDVWCSQPRPFGNRPDAESLPKDGLIAWGLGDWGEADTTFYPKRTPVALTATCGYAFFNRILAQAAAVLGKIADAEHYSNEAERIASALNRTFLDPDTGEYAPDSQTAQILPLQLGLVPEDKRNLVIGKLAQSFAATGNRLSTGFEGTPFLLPCLAEFGLGELAWTVATQAEFPGWFDVVFRRGATTFMEFWDASHVQMPSCQGAIGEWFFRNLAGIQPDPAGPGFRKMMIRPDAVGDLSWVRAGFDSPYGPVRSEWRRDGETFTLDVSIPPNTMATVYLPTTNAADITESGLPASKSAGIHLLGVVKTSTLFEIASGDYRFQFRLSQPA